MSQEQSTKVVRISHAARVTEFLQEFLIISTGKLFCEIYQLVVMLT